MKLAAACSSAMGVPSGISCSGYERDLFRLLANCSLTAMLVAACPSVKAREVCYGR